MDEFEKAFTKKTRILLLNTPHNPTGLPSSLQGRVRWAFFHLFFSFRLGKVFTADELKAISAIVKKHENVVVISDEVYEHLCYDGVKHTSIATLDGMWDRTVTVSSGPFSPLLSPLFSPLVS
jgi:aspartate/methionine/tyrosine aminotransferase